MKLQQLRAWLGADQGVAALNTKDIRELVEDIDRAITEVYEAGVKNGKALALLTVKADEETANARGFRAGHAACEKALNAANEELGKLRVVVRDLSDRNRALEQRDDDARRAVLRW